MADLREDVRERAEECCEFCLIPQQYFKMQFCLDRIVPGQHGGLYTLDNLAYACHFCNRKKGPNLSGIDYESGQMVRLYNPRLDSWEECFRVEGQRIVGRSPVGRATEAVSAQQDRG